VRRERNGKPRGFTGANRRHRGDPGVSGGEKTSITLDVKQIRIFDAAGLAIV